MTTSLNLRNTLGRRLTATEIDANFTNLRSTADAATVDSFTASGTGATARTYQNKNRDIVSIKDYGAVGDGTTDDTAAIQAAINTGSPVMFPGGLTYLAHGLTQSTNGQVLFSDGIATIKKNANGVLLTCSGTEVQLRNLGFRGDAASPTYTGDNINASGNNFSMINCGSRWAYGYAVKSTGSHTRIDGTCDIYQTTDATASGYDIYLGASGTATIYHQISKIYTSQATGGLYCVDTGSVMMTDSQIGKITVASGTSPAGVNGGAFSNNRILGNVTVGLSNSTWAANQFSDITLTFSGGTSGHALDASNVFSNAAVITDSSTLSYIVDIRGAVPTSYTPAWTGASADPVIGNGTIVGRYVKVGRMVHASVRIVMGSTTTFGTGSWYVSLPFVPTTSVTWNGSATILDSGATFYTGVPRTLLDGTARMQIIGNSVNNVFDSGRPITWASGDELHMSITYTT